MDRIRRQSRNASLPMAQKCIVWGIRLLVGLLFVVSGVAKDIDLWGFVFKIEEYLRVWAFMFRVHS